MTLSDHGRDIRIALIGHDTLCIIIHGVLSPFDNGLHIGYPVHLDSDLLIPLKQLHRIETFLVFRNLIIQVTLNLLQHGFHILAEAADRHKGDSCT